MSKFIVRYTYIDTFDDFEYMQVRTFYNRRSAERFAKSMFSCREIIVTKLMFTEQPLNYGK